MLDPFLRNLTDFESDTNLAFRTKNLFESLDVEQKGTLSFQEFSEGLKGLNLGASIHISEEDWEHLTSGRKLCNADNKLELEGFQKLLNSELRDFLQRQLAQSMSKTAEGTSMAAILSTLKLLLFQDRGDTASPVVSRSQSCGNSSRHSDQAERRQLPSVLSAESSAESSKAAKDTLLSPQVDCSEALHPKS